MKEKHIKPAWKYITERKGKEIFNTYFLNWCLQKDVNDKFSHNYPSRHIGKYTTFFRKHGYLEMQHRPHDRNRKLRTYRGTLKPYLDYLEFLDSQLKTEEFEKFLVLLAADDLMRKKIIAENRDLITGLNELLLSYWIARTIIHIIKPLTPHSDVNSKDVPQLGLTLFDTFDKKTDKTTERFAAVESYEKTIWENKLEERDTWWQLFLNHHKTWREFLDPFVQQVENYVDKIKEGVQP